MKTLKSCFGTLFYFEHEQGIEVCGDCVVHVRSSRGKLILDLKSRKGSCFWGCGDYVVGVRRSCARLILNLKKRKGELRSGLRRLRGQVRRSRAHLILNLKKWEGGKKMNRLQMVTRKCKDAIKAVGRWAKGFMQSKEGRNTVSVILVMVVKFIITGSL